MSLLSFSSSICAAMDSSSSSDAPEMIDAMSGLSSLFSSFLADMRTASGFAAKETMLTSLMVMAVMIEKKTSLHVLASEVTIYPQLLKNVRVSNKAAARNNAAVKEAIAEVEKELGDEGRILVRESGTEPVIRVMVEAKKDSICREMVDKVIAVMDKEGLILS